MEPDVAKQILTEVRDIRIRLDTKTDRDEVKCEFAGLRGRFDQLEAATAHGFDVLSARVDGLRADIVRSTRKRH